MRMRVENAMQTESDHLKMFSHKLSLALQLDPIVMGFLSTFFSSKQNEESHLQYQKSN